MQPGTICDTFQLLFRLLLILVLVGASATVRGEPTRRAATERLARSHLATADRAFRQGHYDEALAELQAAYEVDPLPEYLIVFAQVYRAMGDPQRAIDACEMYLSTAPHGPRASEARGLAAVARTELSHKTAIEPPAPAMSFDRADPAATTAATTAATPAAAPRRRRAVVWISVGAVTVAVAGLALGLGLGLGLSHGPPKVSFDPPRN